MIYYKKEGSGNPVFLLHGFPSDHTIWEKTAKALSGKYTFLLPDFPGTGKSDFHADTLFMEDMANALQEVFQKENIERAVIAAHSMGGYVALNFARRFPEKVAGLSLVHSSAYADTEAKKQNRRKAMQLIEKGEPGKMAFLKAMAPPLFDPGFAERHPEIVQSVIDKGKAIPGKSLIAYYHAMIYRKEETETLRHAQFPVQWIIGAEDAAAPKKDLLEQAHLAAVNEVSIYEQCGHLSMLEQPERLTDDLSRFFDFVFEA